MAGHRTDAMDLTILGFWIFFSMIVFFLNINKGNDFLRKQNLVAHQTHVEQEGDIREINERGE